MSETREESDAWKRFIEAEIVHFGHDEEGKGSPISAIALQYTEEKYRNILKERLSTQDGYENQDD